MSTILLLQASNVELSESCVPNSGLSRKKKSGRVQSTSVGCVRKIPSDSSGRDIVYMFGVVLPW